MDGLDALGNWLRRHWLAEMLVAMVLVAGVGLLRFDQVVSVSYRRVPVIAVSQIAGQDMAARAVLVDLGERTRLLRTSDWMIRTAPGAQVCIAEHRLLLRRYTRYALVLPGYCGRAPAAPFDAGLSAAPSARSP